MLELEVRPFMGAAVHLREFMSFIDCIEDKKAPVTLIDRDTVVLPRVKTMAKALSDINARSALAPTNRLLAVLEPEDFKISLEELKIYLVDIESRFIDHLDDIKLFVLHAEEAVLMSDADTLVSFEGFSSKFPRTALEIEESAKCFALGRHTASVFHAMRALEVGLEVLAKFLEIPDPVKATDRSWGHMLKPINDKINERWPKHERHKNSEGSKIEALYATLDAVKNPWRNGTMHVETVYMPHEALHIMRCTAVFFTKLSEHCSEESVAQAIAQ